MEEIPNETTLRAMAEATQILDEWEKMQDEEYNTCEVIDMLQYDYDDEDYDRPLSPETLEAIEEAKKIVAAWRKLREE